MSKRSFPWSVVAGAAIAGATFVGIAGYVQDVRSQPIELPAIPSQSQNEKATVPSEQETSNEKEPTSVRTVRRNKNEEPELSNHKNVSKGVSAKVSALNDAMHDVGYKDIRALSVRTSSGNAIIDMNPAVMSGFGSSQEADFIQVVKTALSQFKDIKTFQIRVDGQIIESLGHLEIIEPVSVR
jgi:hypothetical protein